MGVKYIDRTASTVKVVKEEIQKEVETLTYDKFIGTVGLAADKPLGAIFPHYTDFPEDPKVGNWIRVVSEFLNKDDILLLKGEAWICVSAKSEDEKATWETVKEGELEPRYATTRNYIGRLFRPTPTTLQKISPKTLTFLNLGTPAATGAFNFSDMAKSLPTLTPLSDLVINRVWFDFYLRVDFTPDFTGYREVALNVYRYNPSQSSLYGTFLSSFGINNTNDPAGAPITLWRNAVQLPLLTPPGNSPVTYAVGAALYHTSNIELSVTFAELTIIPLG